ncbi:GFA family protein [Paracoccus siganidrum]
MTGSCACGAIGLQAEGLSRRLSVCWCEPCRRWQGLCGMGIGARAADVKVSGPVRIWRSSEIGERAFCAECSSSLWFRARNGTGLIELTPGLFVNACDAVLDHENFCERRPPGLCFIGRQRQLTAADYAAQAPVTGPPAASAEDPRAGGCACGAIRFRVDWAESRSGACHCRTCQQWSGGVFVAVTVRQEELHVTGAEHLLHWQSSARAERVSCRLCGSKLWYRRTLPPDNPARGDPGDHAICLGVFDVMEGHPLTSEIFIDMKPSGYALAGDHVRQSGPEAMRHRGQ